MIPFQFYRTPRVIFGIDEFFKLSDILAEQKRSRVLLVTGASFKQSDLYRSLLSILDTRRIAHAHCLASGEPSADFVDRVSEEQRSVMPDTVVAIGGGSIIDAGKAVSVMLKTGGKTMDYLEGVGTKQPPGEKVPFIAVPTTAGTGTEASKNAVITGTERGGFKKSLRHDNYTPDVALVDPRLAMTCPRDVTAACGLDALTQLMEAFVSIKANPISDAVAMSGILGVGRSLVKAVEDGDDIEARSDMSYAALMSGIAMANAGLGLVHGIASPLGAAFPIPHGVVCGTLLAETTAAVINKLFDNGEENNTALLKYAEIGKYLALNDAENLEDNCEQLLHVLDTWTEAFGMPRLSEYGVREGDLKGIAAKAGLKESPAVLTADEMEEILRVRL